MLASIHLSKLTDADFDNYYSCLLYTSDAADERSSVDLGGRRIIKKKTTNKRCGRLTMKEQETTHRNNTQKKTKHTKADTSQQQEA